MHLHMPKRELVWLPQDKYKLGMAFQRLQQPRQSEVGGDVVVQLDPGANGSSPSMSK